MFVVGKMLISQLLGGFFVVLMIVYTTDVEDYSDPLAALCFGFAFGFLAMGQIVLSIISEDRI